MVCVVESRIYGTAASYQPLQDHPLRQSIHQAMDAGLAQDRVKRAAQRIVVWSLFHLYLHAPMQTVPQQCLHTPVTLFLMLPHYQAGKQLRQREVLPAEFACVASHMAFSQVPREKHHLPWRFAGYHPIACIAGNATALPNMRRTERVETEPLRPRFISRR
jgi:TRAP-type uncharacterized transport system fused permease subunit